MRVSNILTIKGNTLFAVPPGTPLRECLATMADNDIGALLVMQERRLVGLLTFREIIRVLASLQEGDVIQPIAGLQAHQVMKPDPVVVDPDMDVASLRALMVQRRQRYMPVLSDGVVLGVLSFHDVAKAVHEAQDFENRMLKSYIRDWPVQPRTVAA